MATKTFIRYKTVKGHRYAYKVTITEEYLGRADKVSHDNPGINASGSNEEQKVILAND